MDGSCSANGEDEKYRKDHLGDLDVYGRIICKWTFGK